MPRRGVVVFLNPQWLTLRRQLGIGPQISSLYRRPGGSCPAAMIPGFPCRDVCSDEVRVVFHLHNSQIADPVMSPGIASE